MGQGLLEHPANEQLRAHLEDGDLPVTEYYRQLLRLVYRFLFLLVAEERELLFAEDASARQRAIYMDSYSVSRLRTQAERRRREDLHDDLWRVLAVTVSMMRDGCPALALAPLSGGLFNEESCPDVDGAHLANSSLLTAIRGLSLVTIKGTRRRVNYRDLNVEELGSVYESLLDLHPALRREGNTTRFDLVEGSERKTTGSYYTPPQLVAEVLKNALEPVIARALDGGTSAEKRHRLLALTVCDPAAGSGHFLLAAARRLGREVARLDAGETEPDIETLRRAIREVIGHCIYGVDVNPLAVDLCRLALWIKGHLPGRPLTFLDHRIKCGNSLVGATPEAVEAGLPDDAFTPVSGDDRTFASGIKRRNRAEAPGQTSFFDQLATGTLLGAEASEDEALAVMEIGGVTETDGRALREKEERYEVFRETEAYERKLFLADAWTATFFWHLVREQPDPPTAATICGLREGTDTLSPAQRSGVQALATRHHFFHWHLEFPDVFADDGGFDCVIGNPPWERIKLQEMEFFAARNPAIAKAPNASARKALIAALPQTDPSLWKAFASARRAAEAQSKFVRESGRYPMTAVGDVNTYALFVELFRQLVNNHGLVCIICPTGIATDKTYQTAFVDLIGSNGLVGLIGFINSKKIFPAIKDYIKFALLTMGKSSQAKFMFSLVDVVQVGDDRRAFSLTKDDLLLLNPNTRTCPVFRTNTDAVLTKDIYRRVPVLVDRNMGSNLWSIHFGSMFHMSNDSGLFEATAKKGLVPLYEAKMMYQFDHRFATYENATEANINEGNLPQLSPQAHADPYTRAVPKYWVAASEVEKR